MARSFSMLFVFVAATMSLTVTVNAVDLVDSTVFDKENNVCNAISGDILITVKPCNATLRNGKAIYDVDYTYLGKIQKEMDFSFMFDEDLPKFDAYLKTYSENGSIDYVKIKNNAKHDNILEKNKVSYEYSMIMQPGDTYEMMWIFNPHGNAKKGKWHIFSKESSKNYLDSVNEEDYLYIDPYWEDEPIYNNQEILLEFDDGSGDTATDTMNNYNFELTDAINMWDTTTKRFGAASVKTGTGDYLRNLTLWDTTIPDNITISVWFRLNSVHNSGTATTAALWGKRTQIGASVADAIYLFLAASGDTTCPGALQLNIVHDGTTYKACTTNLNSWLANQWYHTAISWGDTGIEMRVNGTLINSTNIYVGQIDAGSANDFSVGYDSLLSVFTGRLDEFQIWDSYQTFGGSIDIINPLNSTYHTNKIPFKIQNDSVISRFHYQIDGLLVNYTFVPNTTIGLWGIFGNYTDMLKQHNLTVFANNSAGDHWFIDEKFFSANYVHLRDEGGATSVTENSQYNYWFDLDVYNWSAVDSIDVDFIWNNTKQTITEKLGINYTTTITVTDVEADEYITAYWNYTINYENGETVELNSTVLNVTVNVVNMTACGAGGNVTMTFYGLNESSTSQLLDFSMGVLITVDSGTLNFSFAGDNTYYICLENAEDSYIADVDIEYSRQQGIFRNYFYRGVNLTNTTTVTRLYMLDSILGEYIDFNLQDTNYQPLENVTLKAQRYFPQDGLYRIVGMGITGENGATAAFLRAHVYYRYLLEMDNEVLINTQPETLNTQTKVIYVDADEIGLFWEYFDNIAYNCDNDDVNHILSCSYSDTSGVLQSITLDAHQLTVYNNSVFICGHTSSQEAGTLVCDYSGYEDVLLNYKLVVSYTSDRIENLSLTQSVVTPASTTMIFGSSLGVTGAIATIFLLLLFATMGLPSPTFVIIGSLLALIVSFMLQMYTISNVISIVNIIALAIVILYKIRENTK